MDPVRSREMNRAAAVSGVLGRAQRAADQREADRKQQRKDRLTVLLLAASMVIGIGLLAYPTVADYWNTLQSTRLLSMYTDTITELSSEEYEQMMANALEYNRQLPMSRDSLVGVERIPYREALSLSERGIMGTVSIPIIGITLPVYHGTDANVLSVGIGHLEWSSLPVGAYSYDEELEMVTDPSDGAHCVVSGHRGLPSAKLFTDLDQLVEGDVFTIQILNETYTYQVDQIRTVLPEDLSELQIVRGEDYCTLVTCTPYGINSHRLLVRGRRIPNRAAGRAVTSNALQIPTTLVAPALAAPILLMLFVVALIDPFNRERRK